MSLLYMFICLTFTTAAGSYSYQEASKVYEVLFEGQQYLKQFRPRSSMTIQFGLALASIVEVNEKEGYLTTTFVPGLSWTDDRLDFSNISSMAYTQIPSQMVWRPDLEVLNRYRDTIHDNSMSPLLWLYRDGTVLYVNRHTFQTPCVMNLKNFPFDVQTCSIVMGSWAYQSTEVDFIPKNTTDLSRYTKHSDWEVTQTNVTREILQFDFGSVYSFVELRVSITLSRRSSYFYYMYVVPVDLILFFVPFVHILPPSSDCRIFLLSALLICITVMMGVLEDFMPSHIETTPNIVRLYFSGYLLILSSGAITAITMNLANTKSKPVPNILKKLLYSCVGTICLLSSEKQNEYQLLSLSKYVNTGEATSDNRELIIQDGDHQPSTDIEDSPITASLNLLVGELQIARRDTLRKGEWTRSAQLIDRLAAIAFLIATFIVLGISHRSH